MSQVTMAETPARPGVDAPSRKRWYKDLSIQVLVGMALGVGLAVWRPDIGAQMRPLGDAFIRLIQMVVGPIIFCTVVHGIGSMRDLGRVGRVAIKAILYFEIVTSFALVIGLLGANLLQPGVGLNIDPAVF